MIRVMIISSLLSVAISARAESVTVPVKGVTVVASFESAEIKCTEELTETKKYIKDRLPNVEIPTLHSCVTLVPVKVTVSSDELKMENVVYEGLYQQTVAGVVNMSTRGGEARVKAQSLARVDRRLSEFKFGCLGPNVVVQKEEKIIKLQPEAIYSDIVCQYDGLKKQGAEIVGTGVKIYGDSVESASQATSEWIKKAKDSKDQILSETADALHRLGHYIKPTK